MIAACWPPSLPADARHRFVRAPRRRQDGLLARCVAITTHARRERVAIPMLLSSWKNAKNYRAMATTPILKFLTKRLPHRHHHVKFATLPSWFTRSSTVSPSAYSFSYYFLTLLPCYENIIEYIISLLTSLKSAARSTQSSRSRRSPFCPSHINGLT